MESRPIDSAIFARGVYALLAVWMMFSLVGFGESVLLTAALTLGVGNAIAAGLPAVLGLAARAWLLLRVVRPRRQAPLTIQLWQPILLTIAALVGRSGSTAVSAVGSVLMGRNGVEDFAAFAQTRAIIGSIQVLGDSALLIGAVWMAFVHARDLPPALPTEAVSPR